MSPLKYYQLGGFQPQIEWHGSKYDDKELCNLIAGPSSPLRFKGNHDEPLELILGIKQNGSSHLLLTEEQIGAFGSSLMPRHRSQFFSAYQFESLSPICFQTPKELGDKLSSLKPKAGKKGKDTSQANRGYDVSGYDLYRGAFEHGRVVYRILNNAINAAKFGVGNASWAPRLRISSFVINTKGLDHRSSEDKVKNPNVLDVGYCEARIPSLDADYTTAKHVINVGNLLFGADGGKSKKPFNHGNSEKVAAAAMPARIKDFFKECHYRTETPMILLVYNEEVTLNYLYNMGVDIRAWHYGLKDLITPEDNVGRGASSSPGRRSSNQYTIERGRLSNYGTLSYNDYQNRDRDGNNRSRSRSPRLDGRNNSYQNRYLNSPPNRNQRYREKHTPPPSAAQTAPRYPPVFVLDIQTLHKKLTTNDQVKGIVGIAPQFGLDVVDGFCAGNEAGFIIDIWKSMVSGPPIDEQKNIRSGGQGQGAAPHPQATPGAGPSNAAPRPLTGDSDDEQDPNDAVAQPQSAQLASKSQDHYNLDESDYGSSSDSD